ncbi:hypothetical protein TSOC_006197 [Tetrabaena socialis]|uniref:RING-type domain-containing protein n=1 Tax=Tetrabaena socialis TaxID=47790 RepID=A0A2J8A4B0_9CHLO|nr:hypothetical protein TSOC_006197 [Tetrabaena socialis]|eukprot:PNH07343.1 hypothetical protein TSOC_006197 [Tetrabaena socialis]
MVEQVFLCPVCLRERSTTAAGRAAGCRPELERYVVVGCGHSFCAVCLAEHVWRQQSSRRPGCPVCRQPMLLCAPHGDAQTSGTSDSAVPPGTLCLQVGRVRFKVHAVKGGPGRLREFVCLLFNLNPARVKLISQGRVCSDDGLHAAVSAGRTVALMASRGPPAPTASYRVLAWVWAQLHGLARRAWSALPASYLNAAVRTMKPVFDALAACFAALHPSYVGPPAPANGARGR